MLQLKGFLQKTNKLNAKIGAVLKLNTNNVKRSRPIGMIDS